MAARRCARCGHAVSHQARFCERCGAPLSPTARPLRAPSGLEARILQQRTSIEGERKQVTVMYADIVGSMELTARLDAERWGYVLDRFLAIAAAAVHRLEGTVNQFTGDGLLAVFGAPLAHEDHARRACLAVLELQREVALLAAEVRATDETDFAVRCGLNSGEVLVGAIGDDVHMDFVPLGNTTALGKRVEGLAPPGSSALSASTAALVAGEFELRDLGEFAVKGADAPQRLWELVGPGPGRTRLDAVAATRGLSRFVGRASERAVLDGALAAALAGDGSAVGIVGEPGVGKSRLIREFAAGCAERGVAVHAAAGVAHGRYVPLLPIAALYRDICGVGELDDLEAARGRVRAAMLMLDTAFADDLPLLFSLLGVGPPAEPTEPTEREQRLIALVTRTVRVLGHRGPTVLVVEDLHWLDDASALLLDAMIAAAPATRTVLIASYRPEHRAAWTNAVPHRELALAPLGPGETSDLLEHLLGQDGSLHGLESRIATRTAGNPFFIEEIVQALAEGGHLVGARGGYALTSDLDRVALPATVQAGLTDRIDRLPLREKALVQRMAVIGTTVPEPLLATVAGMKPTALAQALDRLAAARWITVADDDGARAYTFRHPLTQEVAYWSQLSDARERAHRDVAAAMEDVYRGRLDDRAALLAHHHEAAADALPAAAWRARAATTVETSPADRLGHWRAVRQLVAGLEPSPERDALAARARDGILSLIWRIGGSPEEAAAVRAEAGADAERLRLDLYAAGSLMHSRRERDGLAAFTAAHRLAVTGGDRGQAVTAALGVSYASWIAGTLQVALEVVDHALAVADGDPAVGAGWVFGCPVAHVHGDRAHCLGYMGDLAGARAHAARAVELADAHDDRETLSAAFASLALVEAEVGDAAQALEHALRGLEIAERDGNAVHVIAASVPAAAADQRAGRHERALARAEADLASIRRQGTGLYFEPILLATIARARLGLGDQPAAVIAAEEAVALGDARGLTTCALAAPLSLAEALLAGDRARDAARIATVLARARRVVLAAGATAFLDRVAALEDAASA